MNKGSLSFSSEDEDNATLDYEEDIIEHESDWVLTNVTPTRWYAFKKQCVYGPVNNARAYAQRMRRVFGWRFLSFLVCSQLFAKGMMRAVASGVMLPLYKNVAHVDAATLQLYTMVVMIPWSVKPIIGLCSDMMVVGGYHKRYWLVGGVLWGTASAALLFAAAPRPALMAICFLGIQLECALLGEFGFCFGLFVWVYIDSKISLTLDFRDLLSEAKYSELRNENPEVGSDATTLAQALQLIGALIAMLFVGIMADRSLFLGMFGICVGLAAVPLLPSLLGWLPEEKLPHTRFVQLIDARTLRKQRPVILTVAFAGLSGILVSLMATLTSPLGE